MKGLFIAIGFVFFVGFLFGLGLLNSSPAPLLAGFCGWTPAMLWLGWSVRTVLIGKRISIVTDNIRPAIQSTNHQRQVREITKKEVM